MDNATATSTLARSSRAAVVPVGVQQSRPFKASQPVHAAAVEGRQHRARRVARRRAVPAQRVAQLLFVAVCVASGALYLIEMTQLIRR